MCMEHNHIYKVQERCRVSGRLLVAPRDKKSRRSYQAHAEISAEFGYSQ